MPDRSWCRFQVAPRNPQSWPAGSRNRSAWFLRHHWMVSAI